MGSIVEDPHSAAILASSNGQFSGQSSDDDHQAEDIVAKIPSSPKSGSAGVIDAAIPNTENTQEQAAVGEGPKKAVPETAKSSRPGKEATAKSKGKLHVKSDTVKCLPASKQAKTTKTEAQAVSRLLLTEKTKSEKPKPVVSVKSTADPSAKQEKEKQDRKRALVAITEKQKSGTLSLHASFSLKTQGSQKANITVPQPFALETGKRASSIMENLGDKEIVKRAFKTFHHSLSLSLPSKTESTKQVTKKWAPKKTACSSLLPYEYQSIPEEREETSNESPEHGKVDGQHHSLEKSVRRPIAKVTYTPFSLKSDERAEKRKEFYMKLEEKMNAKEAEKNQMQAKTKEETEAEIRKFRKSLNFRATPMPSFYQESAPPKKEIKKLPLTRAKSPKLGRRASASEANGNSDSTQGCKSELNGEVKNDCMNEKDTKGNQVNKEAPESKKDATQSTKNATLSKKAHRKDASTQAVKEKASSNKLSHGTELGKQHCSEKLQNHSDMLKQNASEMVQNGSEIVEINEKEAIASQCDDKNGSTLPDKNDKTLEDEGISDETTHKQMHKGNDKGHKEEGRDKAVKPVAGDQHKSLNAEKGSTKAAPLSDTIEDSNGLGGFVGDVAVAS